MNRNTTIKFVQNVLNKNFIDAKEQFKEMFYQKSMESLENKKIALSKSLYSDTNSANLDNANSIN